MKLFNVPADFVRKFCQKTQNLEELANRVYISLSEKQLAALDTLLDDGFRYRTLLEWEYATTLLAYTENLSIAKNALRAGITIQELRSMVKSRTFTPEAIETIAMLSPALDKTELPKSIVNTSKRTAEDVRLSLQENFKKQN